MFLVLATMDDHSIAMALWCLDDSHWTLFSMFIETQSSLEKGGGWQTGDKMSPGLFLMVKSRNLIGAGLVA